ncbi:MAG: hypothetical protein Phog2KO_27950 [Phototrophicaceae bacterium]
MRKLLFLLIFVGMLSPVLAQDEEEFDCTTPGINRQVDLWYNDYLGARGEFEVSQALEAAQVLADDIANLTETCGFIASAGPEEEVPQTGIGTLDDPFIIQAPGVVGDTTIDISEGLRPADDLLIAEGINGIENISNEQEYVVVYFTLSCRLGAPSACERGDDAFRLIGDMGILYEPTVDQFDLYLAGSVPINGGSQRAGALPFLVDRNDTTLRLVYYPEGNALDSNPQAFYFDAQGRANSFEVRSTTAELIVRNAPSSSGAPVGVLRSSQVATANGQSEDGEWISIEAPEGTGWVSADFLTSDSDLESLSVIREFDDEDDDE